MPRIEPPKPEPMGKAQISDFERFAKAYFGIELTTAQLEMVEFLAKGLPKGKSTLTIHRIPQNKAALDVLQLYLIEGLKPDGRARLPQLNLPAHMGRTKTKAKTQSGRILELISRPGGAFNFELSRIALQFCARIHELREDGHAIICERQYLKNGKASNTFRYRLGGH